MKKYLVIVLLLALVIPVVAQLPQNGQKVNGPVLTLEKTSHDFGDIFQGDKVDQIFKFTNTGNEPLIITEIRITCGCTQPEWPRNPIPPGGKGEIKVGFNSAGKMGIQTKSLPVISNATNDVTISFSTNVLRKDPQ